MNKVVPFTHPDVPATARPAQSGSAVANLHDKVLSDDAIAKYLAEKHAGTLRYVEKFGAWYLYDGRVWRKDETRYGLTIAASICNELADKIADFLPYPDEHAKAKRALTSKSAITNAEFLARSDANLAATVEQWDADAWALNTPGGTVDLRDGTLRPHAAADYLTKMAAVAPLPTADCPQFLAFLYRIMNGNRELIAYLQRVLGYALTGDTAEHALFFAYGTGANGKSVLLNTISHLLGDYATVSPMETFIASNSDRHPTDLAGLRGARFVSSIETEEGKRWAESRIKQMTGGDPITARFMRQDYFTFTPVFKLFIAGNHKPSLRSVDEAMRRRFHLIPFAVTIPAHERDPQLPDKLKAEWPGILRWMIDGCLEWQRSRLGKPQAVIDATKDYLESEDALGNWIEERCERHPSHWASVAMLFLSWKGWAEANGEFALGSKRFSQALEARGFQRETQKNERGFLGLRLTSAFGPQQVQAGDDRLQAMLGWPRS